MNFVSTNRSKKRYLFGLAGLLIVIALALVGLELTNTTHLFHPESVATTGNSYTKGEPSGNPANIGSSSLNSTSSSASTQPGDEKSSSGGSSTNGATLLAPTGDFVSNHHPYLSGSPAPNTLASVCTTTPGASCKIVFTKDGIVKSLPVQTADRGGSAYWNWKLQDIGLTAGSWHVQAVATLGSQTKTSDDALAMEVSQ